MSASGGRGQHLWDEDLCGAECDDRGAESLAEEREARPRIRAEEAGVGERHRRDVGGDGEAKLLPDRLLEDVRFDRVLRVYVNLQRRSR